MAYNNEASKNVLVKDIFINAEKQKNILFAIFDHPFMGEPNNTIFTARTIMSSVFLQRTVTVDYYLPSSLAKPPHLLLINDGQMLAELGLLSILQDLTSKHLIKPLVCLGIHAGTDRKMEYGTAHQTDYMGRGALAAKYTRFVMEELLPGVGKTVGIPVFKEKAYAGFSLGGLSALDIVWNQPAAFSKVGVFSGSLWWRKNDITADYNEQTDRIMHTQIRKGKYHPGLQFFFETGTQDETVDRNNNGVIDAIDDTISLIDELVSIGYNKDKAICYLEVSNGKHDIATWASVMPDFLKWGWGV